MKKVKKPKIVVYTLEVKPALEPNVRHRIEDTLERLGYTVIGGGTCLDMSACDISFEWKEGK